MEEITRTAVNSENQGAPILPIDDPPLASAAAAPSHAGRHADVVFLPRTSVSVMVVLDERGYFTQLWTAGDLLRWCKAAWRAEREGG